MKIGQLNGIDGAEFTVSLSSVIEMADKREARIGVISERSVLLKAERKIETLTLLGEVTRRYIIVLSAQDLINAICIAYFISYCSCEKL